MQSVRSPQITIPDSQLQRLSSVWISVPQSQDQPVQRVLDRVVTAVDEQQIERALFELVANTVRACDPKEAGGEACAGGEAQVRFGADEGGETEGSEQGPDKGDAEDHGHVGGLGFFFRHACCLHPGFGEQNRRIP